MNPWLAMASAFWLGIQTSISPCPLATNIAAVAFLSRNLGQPRRVLISGWLYALGRIVAYVALSVLLLWLLKDQLAGGGALSRLLQKYGLLVIGPALILLGMLLLGMLTLPGNLGSLGADLQERASAGGMWWSGILGFVFALSFCPASAALFFVLFIPIAASQSSMFLLPTLYGVGTALPVIAFAFLMVFASHLVSKVFTGLTVAEKWIRVAVGVIFIAAGLFYTLTVIYGIKITS